MTKKAAKGKRAHKVKAKTNRKPARGTVKSRKAFAFTPTFKATLTSSNRPKIKDKHLGGRMPAAAPRASKAKRTRATFMLTGPTSGFGGPLDLRKGEDLATAARRRLGQDTRELSQIKVGRRHRKDYGDIAALARSIDARGALLQPIVIDGHDKLIAGDRRMKAWARSRFARQPIPVHVVDIDSIVAGERDENAERKDFTPSEAVAIKRDIEAQLKKLAKDRQRKHGGSAPGRKAAKAEAKGRAADHAARFVGKDRKTLAKAEEIVEAAEQNPKKFGKLKADMDKSGRVDGPHKRLKVMQQTDALRKAPPPLPMQGPYKTVSVDFPWPAEGEKEQEAIDAAGRSFRPYPEMSIKSCCKFAREQIVPILADDCSVWLHVPNHHLVKGYAHHVIAALGFDVALVGGKADDDAKGQPVTMLTWKKDRIGRGQVLRDQTEHVILLTRGKPLIDVYGKDPPTTFLPAPRRANSQKPEEFYRLVERVTPAARYAAIFSTGGEGPLWDCHGDQVGKHAPAEARDAALELAAAAGTTPLPDPPPQGGREEKSEREKKAKSCRVCGCTQDQACPGGCAWSERDAGICTACEASLDHPVTMTNPDGQSVATCTCGKFENRLPWGGHYEEQEKAIRQHWQDVVALAGGVPPPLRRRGNVAKASKAAAQEAAE
jgi:N6-adenosine-specific RNA methylase IME4